MGSQRVGHDGATELNAFAPTWTDLDRVTLSEARQIKTKYQMPSLSRRIFKKGTNKLID